MKDKNAQVGSASNFFASHANVIAIALTILTFFVGLLLFNVRVDEGGDDSTYITRAIDLVGSGTYPTYQGPLYPMFLAIFVAIFGANVVLLKFTSLLLVAASQYIFYRMLRGRVGDRAIFAVMGLMSINSIVLFFGSMTYSEALFTVVQYLFFATILRCASIVATNKKSELLSTIPPAVLVVLAYLIRTVGFGLGIVGVVFLCIQRKYLRAAMFVGAMALTLMLWMGIRYAVWGEVKSDNRQIESLMQVHPYQAEDGQETIAGYAGRVVDNSNLYISKHLMRILGLHKADDRSTSGVVTLLFYLLFGYGAYRVWRRGNVALQLMVVSSVVMLGITFVVLQALWDQVRLVVPYVAPALLIVLFALMEILRIVLKSKAELVMSCLVGVCGMFVLSQTISKIDMPTLRRNLKGDMLYGYTPDWYNYLSVCKEVYNQLPQDAYVACRKPNMARIYSGGHKFFGIYNFYTEDADELVDNLKEHNVTHIIVASLRRDPLIPNDQVINTIHRYMKFVMDKYPNAFELCGQCGSEGNEPTYLFAVRYDYIEAMRAHLATSANKEDSYE